MNLKNMRPDDLAKKIALLTMINLKKWKTLKKHEDTLDNH